MSLQFFKDDLLPHLLWGETRHPRLCSIILLHKVYSWYMHFLIHSVPQHLKWRERYTQCRVWDMLTAKEQVRHSYAFPGVTCKTPWTCVFARNGINWKTIMLAMFHYSQPGNNLVYVIEDFSVLCTMFFSPPPPFSICKDTLWNFFLWFEHMKDSKVSGLQNTFIPHVINQKEWRDSEFALVSRHSKSTCVFFGN